MAPLLYMMHGSPGVGAVLITAEAIGLKLNHNELNLIQREHLSPEYLKINPQHTIPTLNDDGFVIWDSHAINAYLVGKYGKDDSLYPKDLQKRAVVDQRLYFECGVLFPLLKAIDRGYVTKEFKQVPAKLVQEVKDAYDIFEKIVEGHEWATGDSTTIADFTLYTTTLFLDFHVTLDPTVHPNLCAWLKRVRALPCSAVHEQGLKNHFYCQNCDFKYKFILVALTFLTCKSVLFCKKTHLH